MPLGYSGAPRITQSNQASRTRRLSRSLTTGNNGTPLIMKMFSSEEFKIDASPVVGNTLASRPVIAVWSTEFTSYPGVQIGYYKNAGQIKLLYMNTGSEIFSINVDGINAGIPVTFTANTTFAVNTTTTFNSVVQFNANTTFAVNTNTVFNSNTSFTAPASHTSTITITDNSASTDPFMKVLQVGSGDAAYIAGLSGGQQYSFGVDNSDSDKFKISASNTLGTSDVFEYNPSSNTARTLTSASFAKSISAAITTVSANATLNTSHFTVLVDATSAAITITLPPVASSSGLIYQIKKIDSSVNAVTIDGDSGDLIDGNTTYSLPSQWDKTRIHCDGSAWYIV